MTVVVSDLQGSTALAERLDPESLRLILDEYFDELGRVLQSRGGRIEKRVGDAIITLFGFPVAGEHDATEAARAVVECQLTLARLNEHLDRTWKVRLTNRTGMCSGLISVTNAGGGHRVLSGRALDNAMDLETVAPPLEALLAPESVAELAPNIRVGAPATYTLKHGGSTTGHRLLDVDLEDEVVVTGPRDASGACTSCGAASDDVVYSAVTWCVACGTRFSRGGHVQSRRTLTILFADMRATGADEHGVATSGLIRCFEEARTVLEHHGGIVEKFIGDAVMAVFGLERRREDDSLRAVRAGLEIQRRIHAVTEGLRSASRLQIEVRIGINTGPVIAGDPALGQRLVTGDAVNVAARLEQAAAPGSVLIGALTRRLCGSALIGVELSPLHLKGKSELVSAFQVMQVDSAVQVSHGVGVPMIGRSEELERLMRELPAAMACQGLRRVDVRGEGGLGKSRLVNEFLDGVSEDVSTVRTMCPPYGEGITFWPIVELITQLSSIHGDDDAAAALRKLDATIGDPAVALRLASLLGLVKDSFPLSELFWSIRRLVESAGSARPLVLVIDGLHRAEPTLLELLEHLARNVTGAAVLLVTMARPEDLGDGDVNDDPAADVSQTARIFLEPLREAEVEELLRLSIGGDLPALVREQVVRVSGGNPLFVEQLAIMLVENGCLKRRGADWVLTAGLEHLDVPSTLEALLAARIDSLTPKERAVLEPASIIGREFPTGAVGVLAPRISYDDVVSGLTDLGRRRLVVAARTPDALVDHRFANLLIRDVVYAGLLKRTRATWHEGFAAWLEDVLGSRVAEYAEVIGYHLEQSYNYQQELGAQLDQIEPVGRRAFGYLAPSGERAFVRGDMPAASTLLSRAASLLAPSAPERNRVLIRAGEARMQTGRFAEAVAHFDEAERGARASDDRVTAAAAELARATLRFQTGDGFDYAAAREVVERLRPIFDVAGDHASAARCWRLHAYADLTNSQWGAAEVAMTALIGEARLAGDTVLELRVLPGLVGFALHGPTPVRKGIAHAMQLRASTDADRRARALTERYMGHLLALDGQGDAGRDLCIRARESLLELGWTFEAALVSIDLGPVELTCGRAANAEDVLRNDYDLLRSMGEQNYVSTTAGFLAEAVRRQGRPEEALQLADFSASCVSPADVLTQALWREVRAMTLCDLDRSEEAEVLAVQALALVINTDGLSSRGDAYITLAEVLTRLGRSEEARSAAHRAAWCFRRKGHLPGQLRSSALLENLK